MKNDTLLMHRLHGPDRKGHQSQGTNAKCIFILRPGVHRERLIVEISRESLALPGAMALLSPRPPISFRRRSITRNNRLYSGREIEEKASLRSATKPETSERLIRYHRMYYSEHVRGDRTATNNNTYNLGTAKINMPIEF